jgi:hypothetical protein
MGREIKLIPVQFYNNVAHMREAWENGAFFKRVNTGEEFSILDLDKLLDEFDHIILFDTFTHKKIEV